MRRGAKEITDALRRKIRRRFQMPEWAMFEEFTLLDGRRMDALLVNLYASRGFVSHGFEIKATRSDWLRELRDGAKAEEAFRLCSTFSLIIPKRDMVKEGELPPGWGLLTETEKGLREAVKAKRRPDREWPEGAFMALLRKAFRETPDEAILKREVREARREGRLDGEAAARGEDSHEFHKLRELAKRVSAFEKASGIMLAEPWRGGEETGRAVKFVLNGGWREIDSRLRWMTEQAKHLGGRVEDLKKALAKARREFRDVRPRTEKERGAPIVLTAEGGEG